ncbi:MAG: M6 family metalloprotease domain-containing protein [Prevotella sp.]|nr:M6 family metalloprotease domain-containing protein [Prevotella sp.]
MKKAILSIIMILAAVSVSAVPAKRGVIRTLTLSDGTTVSARLVGDEHGHYWLSQDGRAFISTGNQAVDSQDIFQQVSLEAISQRADIRRTQSNARRAKRLSSPKRVGEYGDYTGSKKGLIILVNFTNVTFQDRNNKSLFERIANNENFSYGNFVGSIHDYFYDQSEGQFDLTFDVAGPYNVSHTQSYYGGNDSDGNDKHPAEMVIEACQLADADVNFADYDWNGDGYVDQVYVIYAGKGEADGGGSNTIWPHEWDLESAAYYGDGLGAQKFDDMWVNTYACGSELNGSSQICGIGTMCHEFSHCLGFPDFYDTGDEGSRGMDVWDLMDVGSYNGNGYRPAGYTSYERWMAGWKTPIELNEDTLEVTGMKSLQEGGESYIIYNDGNKDEYYLLENRQKVEWDKGLPGEGLLILHVDYDQEAWYYNTVNNTYNHQRMTWVAADNKYQTSYGYISESGMANDPFPYGEVNSFGNNTTPAATLFNNNTDGTKFLNKLVYDITKNDDGTIDFKYLKGAEPPAIVTGDGEYRRVVSTDELTEDASYLIVYEASSSEGTAYAGVTTGSTSYGQKVDVEINGYTIDIDSISAQPVKLKKAGDDTWYILDDTYYLCYESGNSLDKNPICDGKGFTWTIEPTSITNTDYASYNRRLQYNKSSNAQRFACYRGTQQDVVLYMKAEDPDARKDPELAFDKLNVTAFAETVDFEEPTLQNPNNLEVVYTSDNESLATVDANTGEVMIGSDAGEVIITASFGGDETYKPGWARYRITVTKKEEADLSFPVNEVTVEAETADFEEPVLQNPHDLEVSYSSSNELLATVDAKTGEVTIGSEAGTLIITAYFEGNEAFKAGSASYQLIITEKTIVKEDADLSFLVNEVTVEAETADFEEPVLQNPHELEVSYSSSNELLATVDAQTGEVTIGSEPGTLIITALFHGNDYFNEGSASYTINIAEKQDVGIESIISKIPTEVVIYDLQGRRLTEKVQLKPGLYIIGGKKVVVK